MQVEHAQIGTTLSLGQTEIPHVSTILNLPDDSISRIRHCVLRRYANESLSLADLSWLVDNGLVQPTGAWTELGAEVADLIIHAIWQEGDETFPLLQRYSADLTGAVLDVGCSTGWLLRQMPAARRRAGVDVHELGLALGYRLAEIERQEVEFSCASAHQLPFPDNSFDCVICRNTITYTEQRRSLQEMTRVLRPGGLLLIRYENFRYDLRGVLRTRNAKAWCCRLRDFAFGILHGTIGWQIPQKWRFAPGRTFGSTIRLRRTLGTLGCRVLHTVDAAKCPRLLGRATQTALVACKALYFAFAVSPAIN